MRFIKQINGAGVFVPLKGAIELSPQQQRFFESCRVGGMEPPPQALEDSIVFLNKRYLPRWKNNPLGQIIFWENHSPVPPELIDKNPVLCKSIHLVIHLLVEAFSKQWDRSIPFNASGDISENKVHPSAVVDGYLEGGVTVGAGCYIGNHSFIGKGTVLQPNVTVLDHSIVGKNCLLQSGVVIGPAGFGFNPHTGEPLPHLAGVEIGDQVWIGANSVVAAGVLQPTRVGSGTRLDSHVQIAHNVQLGKRTAIASLSAIGGSAEIGDDFTMGGLAAVDSHCLIGNKVTLAACSAITKNTAEGEVVAGFPARAIKEWKKQQIILRNLSRG